MTRLPLAIGAFVMAATVFAQSPNNWSEQWSRAKFGRHSPKVDARLRQDAANTAYRNDPSANQRPLSAYDRWFKAKFGRYSPAEEARRRAEAANTAYRDLPPDQDPRRPEVQYRDFFKAKFGRELPKK